MTEVRFEPGGARGLTLERSKHKGFTAYMSFVMKTEGRFIGVCSMMRERVRFRVDRAAIRKETDSSRMWEVLFAVRESAAAVGTRGEVKQTYGPVRWRRGDLKIELPDPYTVDFEGVMCDTRWLLDRLARWSDAR